MRLRVLCDWQTVVLHQLVLRNAVDHDAVDGRSEAGSSDWLGATEPQRSDDRLQHGRPTILGRQTSKRHRVVHGRRRRQNRHVHTTAG